MSSIVQSHIHISTSIGSAPENAPTLKWKVRDRQEIPVVKIEISETLDFSVYAHVVGNDSPVSRTNFQYEIKIATDTDHDVLYYKSLLLGMNGREVYLVDNFHPVDGSDHTAYITRALLVVDQLPAFVANLEIFYIPVSLYSLENPT